MRKITVLLAAMLLVGMIGSADATPAMQAYTHEPAITADGPSSGGLSSDNVEYIRHIPLSVDGVGGRVVGRYFYTNDQQKIMIFDLKDPLNPVLTDVELLPQEWLFSREDIDTNGKVLVVPNLGTLYVFDVEDKSNITLLGTAPGGQHTQSCIDNCRFAYGSSGAIHDLRDPANPKLLDKKWGDGLPAGGGHDVEEIRPGLTLTATQPIMALDTRNPLKPKLLATGSNTDARFIHSGRWAQGGKDKFLLMGGETNFRARCSETTGAFMTWDASHYKKTHTFRMIDEYRMMNGTYTDGNPAVNQVGCSSHWLEAHPDFKNGGIVAAAFFEHGTRFIEVSSKGKIKEVGWFMPAAGSTGAAYWVNDEIVYAVDYNRGIDILRWKGTKAGR